MDDEVRAICRSAAEKIAKDGIAVDEKHPDMSDAGSTFLTLRGAVYIARHGGWLEQYRNVLKPEIVKNTEYGLSLKTTDVVAAEIKQGDITRRLATFMQDYDALICATVLCPPFDVDQRYPEQLNGVRFEGYMGWLILTYAVTVTACPVMALPCGFTKERAAGRHAGDRQAARRSGAVLDLVLSRIALRRLAHDADRSAVKAALRSSSRIPRAALLPPRAFKTAVQP